MATVGQTTPIMPNTTHNETYCEPELLIVRWPLLAFISIHVNLVVIAVGVPCNALAYVVLLRDRSASTTRVFLLALAVADNLILLLVLFAFPLRSLYDVTNWPPLKTLGFAGPYIWALSNMAKFYQVWLTVMISADRFYCVRFPLTASRVCTPRRASFLVLLLPLVSLALNVPRLFVYRRHLHRNNCTGRLSFKFEWLGLPDWFKLVFIEMFESLFFFIIPLVLLVFLNAALIRSLQVVSQKRSNMVLSRVQSCASIRTRQSFKRDRTVTLTLIAVVTAFILFETPIALLNIVSLITSVFDSNHTWGSFWTGPYVRMAVGVCTILTLLNSSANFFLYVLVNNNFRKDLLQMFSFFRCGKQANEPVQPRSRIFSLNNTNH